MKRIVLLLILFCSITVSAQQKQRKVVKLTTRQGVSYVGFLEELKTFEYVLLEVGEKRVQIPFDDMAYIDELKRIETDKDDAKKEKVEVKKEVEEVKKEEPKVEEVPKPIEVKIPEHETEPVVAKVELEKVEEAPNLESLPVPVPVAEPEPEPVVAPVVKEPELKAELLKVVEPEPAPETVSAKVTSKFANYHGFLLEEGNNVYLSCLSSPKNVAYDDAAIDVLTRQILRDGFWHIVDNPEDAHFVLSCIVNKNDDKVSVGISSDLTGGKEELGSMKGSEDVTEYRKLVWELYNKYIIPLEHKIEKGSIPKHTKKNFTVE
jgi:hypothetical protein